MWIYGAKRSNHGQYNATLDGKYVILDGFDDGGLFQQVLFSAVGLDDTMWHTVSITSQFTDYVRRYLDVGSVSILIM